MNGIQMTYMVFDEAQNLEADVWGSALDILIESLEEFAPQAIEHIDATVPAPFHDRV